MDEPIRGRLRAARRRGLTSLGPLPAPRRPPTATRQHLAPSRRSGQAAEQASGGKATPRI